MATVLAIGLIVADHNYRYLDLPRSTLSVAVHPVYYLAGLSDILVRKVQDRLATEEALRQRNEALHREHLVLRARLQQLEALEAENMRLRDLLGSSLKISNRVLMAELLAVDLDPHRRQVMINRGAASGVFVGQPVLGADTVMGQVTRVDPRSATVLLITDANHGLPVQINRNGLRTVAQGTGVANRLKLLHLPQNADVWVRDLLVTSGLGGHFPPGYPVARIAEVRQEPGKPFATVIAEPTARLDRSREVLLVWTVAATGSDRIVTKGTGKAVRKSR